MAVAIEARCTKCGREYVWFPEGRIRCGFPVPGTRDAGPICNGAVERLPPAEPPPAGVVSIPPQEDERP